MWNERLVFNPFSYNESSFAQDSVWTSRKLKVVTPELPLVYLGSATLATKPQ